MKKFSTGALTKEQLAKQEEVYNQRHSYDYIIIGTGMSALSVGALLAHAGQRVCLLEAHDKPGGYAHTFEMNDFHFCAQVHYIWGCDQYQAIGKMLKKLGLQDDITFEQLSPDGYDHIILPDGQRIKTPNGFDKYALNINSAYPGYEKNIKHFFSILDKLIFEMGELPEKIHWWNFITHGYKYWTLFKYRNQTLQNLFDECQLPLTIQAILSGISGDLMSPPKQLSLIAYASLLGGYNSGAYYPTKHFKYFIERMAQFITEHAGCHIFYETRVTDIKTAGSQVTEVYTEKGKIFKAPRFISNMDPKHASTMIGREKFPKKSLAALDYGYTQSSFFVYLGVKGIDLTDYGFGNHNTWHLEQWDMNASWKEMSANCYDKPWIFMSTPTLHSSYPGIAPEGCQILEFGTMANYDYFHELHKKSPAAYRKAKNALADKLFQIVEEKHVPNLSAHIALKVVGTPTTNADFCFAPYGNAYGSVMIPENMSLNRLKADTPFDNLFWCNASSGYASIYGTTLTGSKLYTKLTGDTL